MTDAYTLSKVNTLPPHCGCGCGHNYGCGCGYSCEYPPTHIQDYMFVVSWRISIKTAH